MSRRPLDAGVSLWSYTSGEETLLDLAITRSFRRETGMDFGRLSTGLYGPRLLEWAGAAHHPFWVCAPTRALTGYVVLGASQVGL